MVVRASLAFVLAAAGCPAESPECPAGDLGCPCRPDRECIAGLQCDDDGVCRDDEPLETDTLDASTTIDDATATDPTTFEPTTLLPSTSGASDTADITTADPQCVCGWSFGQEFYTCGWDLPPAGPPEHGVPECPIDGLAEGVPCDALDPPVTVYGCCLAGSILAFCHPGTGAIVVQECLVTDLGCAAVE